MSDSATVSTDAESWEIAYHGIRMLLTLDLQHVFSVLLEQHPTIILREMSDQERAESESVEDGVTFVHTRFMVYLHAGAKRVRERELEQELIAGGAK